MKRDAHKYIFGLDIGTRSIVGTVGYKERDRFVVAAQFAIEHETRAMMDGQIHDIAKVGQTIQKVKNKLEAELDCELQDVCIAAAGRVLRTVDVHSELTYEDEKTITEEDVYELHSAGIEKAYETFGQKEKNAGKFYCVGYSVVRYFMNQYPISTLLDHKARSIEADMIATFLPNDVVDGLYKAVEFAGLNISNLTLEPIAAMLVAVPDRFRMLNIGLVDVGAGTSDISITRDGSIIAYGMLPIAGDILTETIAKRCLVDFNTAEMIKRDYSQGNPIVYEDIMGLEQKISAKEIEDTLRPVVQDMTKQVADKMKELNGGHPVSAVFVVGGGGKILNYTETLAEYLDLPKERVAVRGKEVMGQVDFENTTLELDSRLVTPIGICLSFYEQSNNFIFVHFNKERVKLYDNGKLSVVDAAMNADFPSDGLFPKRGKELEFTVNGKPKMIRGMLGEAAQITVNGEAADIHTPIHENDVVVVKPSTAGDPATMMIRALPELRQTLKISVNDKEMELPAIVYVNGELKSEFYDIQNGDHIELADYYTVEQIMDVTDVVKKEGTYIYVNHQKATLQTKVYANFQVTISLEELFSEEEVDAATVSYADLPEEDEAMNTETKAAEGTTEKPSEENTEESAQAPVTPHPIDVIVNQKPITLNGKAEYVLVDVFDYIEFDLSKPQGKSVVTLLNGEKAQYMTNIQSGDVIEIYWEE